MKIIKLAEFFADNIEEEYIQEFVTYNYVPIKKRQIVMHVLVVWGLFFLAHFMVDFGILPLILLSLVSVFVTVYMVMVLLSQNILPKHQHFLVGIHFIQISLLLALMSYQLISRQSGDSGLLMLACLGVAALGIAFWVLMAYRFIKKGAYKKSPKNSRTAFFSTLGCIAGMGLARATLPQLSQEVSDTFFPFMLLIFSMLMGSGGGFLLRWLCQIYLDRPKEKRPS